MPQSRRSPFRPGTRPRPGRPFRRNEPPDSPPRSAREAALDRIQEIRVGLDRKSLLLKRGNVFAVAATIGFGFLQGWWWLSGLAIPLGLTFWWLDGSVTRADERLQRLYEAIFEGRASPPGMGEEMTAADRLPDPPGAVRRALLSGPGAGLHLMMVGIALGCNLFL